MQRVTKSVLNSLLRSWPLNASNVYYSLGSKHDQSMFVLIVLLYVSSSELKPASFPQFGQMDATSLGASQR